MDSDQVAIKVENISKNFKLPHEKNNTIKGAVVNFWRQKRGYETFEALKDVSLTINKGEFFGIIGRNGSGKSTLLKSLAGIYSPTKGSININGKLVPFIELGVGFSPELSGRDNVFLNGSLLGFNRRDMAKMYKDIVEFAELERFMDQKLKNYSSGMQVRLAFSIAIRAQSDILVLDEVLAVGDASFQKKCNTIFNGYKKSNKTVVLVTHDMQAVRQFCQRVALIDNGELKGVYTASEAAAIYQEINSSNQTEETDTKSKAVRRWGDGKVKVKKVTLKTSGRITKSNKVKQGDDLELSIQLESKKDQPVTVGLMFEDSDGINVSGPNSKGVKLSSCDTVSYRIKELPLYDGDYKITIAVFSEDLSEEHDHIYHALDLTVFPGDKSANSMGKVNFFGNWSKVVG